MYETGGFVGKVTSVFLTSLAVSFPIVWLKAFDLINDHIFSDWQPATGIMIALLIDMITGGWKHIKLGTFSSGAGFTKFMQKFSIVLMALLLSSTLGSIVGDNSGGDYVKVVLYAVAWVYPSLSAFGNMYIITNKKFPPMWLMDNLKAFWESGDINKLKSVSKENQKH